MDMSYNKLGALLKAALGSSATATQIGLSGIYKQVHALGDPTNKSLTVQIGRPQASDGVVKPFTYPGAVVTEIEFSVSDGELGKVRVSFDAKDEQTATGLAAASYIAGLRRVQVLRHQRVQDRRHAVDREPVSPRSPPACPSRRS
jgi:hypothetical protein